ncbi:hypothetical protein HUJ04_011019, partial [Dendroctonus ponderosae]
MGRNSESFGVTAKQHCVKDDSHWSGRLSNVTTKDSLKPSKRIGRNEWMTQENLNIMESRRGYNNKDITSYHNINKTIKNKIKEAKERCLKNCCKEIESLLKKHD